MTLINTTMRPGFLVACKSGVRGAVSYARTEIEPEHVTADGKLVHEWETRKVVANAEEHDRACKAREKARGLIRSVCIDTAGFGMLCPIANEKALSDAIAAARAIANEFNLSSKLYRVKISVMRGRVASDDDEAVRAIGDEISELLDGMQGALGNFDVKAIRDAANRARALSSMLQPGAAAKVQEAIEAARASANSLAKAEREGINPDQGQTYAGAAAVIAQARAVFLDLDETVDVATPVAQAAQLDMGA